MRLTRFARTLGLALQLTTAAAGRAQAAPDAILAATPTPAIDSVPSDSALAQLRKLFKYQVVARVSFRAHLYMVQDPRIEADGFTHGRVIEPSRVTAGEVPATIPWPEVDSLLLRRTHAMGIGSALGLTLGVLGGLAGYAVGGNENSNAGPVVALAVGVAAGGLGFLAGGFLGGFVQYWTQVYPERTPEPDWRRFRKRRGER